MKPIAQLSSTQHVLTIWNQQVNWCQGDGFRTWVHEWVPFSKLTMAGTYLRRIGGANFLIVGLLILYG